VNKKIFTERTERLAISILRLVEEMPKSVAATAIARQFVRSGTSFGANYRAACCAKPTVDMINKLKIVEEAGDETAYRLALCAEMGYLPQEKIAPTANETDEILAMTVASIKTLCKRN
jgi:four helix bundle protein